MEASSMRVDSPQTQRGPPLGGSVFKLARPTTAQPSSARPCQEKSAFILPQEREGKALVTSFFSNTGWLFPFMHEETFMNRYLATSGDRISQTSRSWLGLLNIVFAMAISTHYDPHLNAEERFTKSAVYYERGLSLCSRDVLKGANMDIGPYLDQRSGLSFNNSDNSTLPFALGPIPSGNEIHDGGLVREGSDGQSSIPAWPPVANQPGSSAASGAGGSQTHVVCCCLPRSVRRNYFRW